MVSKTVLVVGGGTAGWITAAYLAKVLAPKSADGIRVTLVESRDIGIIGVGEGTFPSIRKVLKRIGVDEADLIRECSATFKQGIRFVDWRYTPGQGKPDHYVHPFDVARAGGGLDLLPYWLLGCAGDVGWDAVSTVQRRVADDDRAPKLISHEDYGAPLNYAYHFDAAKLAALLRKTAIGLGVHHVVDTIDAVHLTPDGAIDSLTARDGGKMTADLYIDCTGFRAQLIGEAMKIPFGSRRSELFTDRAVAIQVPYDRPDAPIPSYTISSGQEAGWTWDIGLDERRGVGYVYSSDHTTDERAEAVLRAYIGPAADGLAARVLKFEPGYRQTQWRKNCVAIGLSAGFIEPLEATGIGFAEIAALNLSNLFPWAGPMETPAKQFNEMMAKRYDHVVDFIKLHYCLSERRDSDFWRDNVAASSMSDSLKERLERWRYRPPLFMDVDLNHDIFTEANWQYVLYGMGYKTDLTAQAGVYRYHDEARAEFAAIQRRGDYALTIMPKHRDLIAQVRQTGFAKQTARHV